MQIDSLRDQPEHIPTVAHWVYDEWSDIMPHGSFEEWLTDLRGRMRSETE